MTVPDAPTPPTPPRAREPVIKVEKPKGRSQERGPGHLDRRAGIRITPRAGASAASAPRRAPRPRAAGLVARLRRRADRRHPAAARCHLPRRCARRWTKPGGPSRMRCARPARKRRPTPAPPRKTRRQAAADAARTAREVIHDSTEEHHRVVHLGEKLPEFAFLGSWPRPSSRSPTSSRSAPRNRPPRRWRPPRPSRSSARWSRRAWPPCRRRWSRTSCSTRWPRSTT